MFSVSRNYIPIIKPTYTGFLTGILRSASLPLRHVGRHSGSLSCRGHPHILLQNTSAETWTGAGVRVRTSTSQKVLNHVIPQHDSDALHFLSRCIPLHLTLEPSFQKWVSYYNFAIVAIRSGSLTILFFFIYPFIVNTRNTQLDMLIKKQIT